MLSTLCIAALTLVAPRQDGGVQAPRTLLEALPGDAVLALTIEDVPALWGRARTSAWADVLRAAPFAPLWSWLDDALQEDVVQGELTASELADAVQSAALFYELLQGDEPLAAGLAVRMRPDQVHVGELLQVTLESESELVEHQGRDVSLAGNEGEWMAVLDWREGFALGMAADRDGALDRAVALALRLEHGSEDGRVARLHDRRPSEPASFELYLDMGLLAARQAATMDEDERARLEPFALGDLGWLSVHATLGEGVATEVSTRIELPESGLLARWAACARPVPVELARLAPADAIEVALLGYDFGSAWSLLREALAASMPEQAAQLEAGLQAGRDTAGIDVEHDLIEQLTGEFAEFLLPARDTDTEAASTKGMVFSWLFYGLSGLPGSSPGSVLVLGLRETGPVEDVLEALLEVSGAGELIEDEQVAGRWMTSIVSPDIPLRPTWAFLEGALAFSLQAAPVRALLAQAAEDAPPPWLEVDGRRQSIAGNENAFACSVADLEAWLQAEIVAPLAGLHEIFEAGQARRDPGSPDEQPELAAVLSAIAEALPELVEGHLRGAMRATMTLEGRVLSYRVWTR